MLAKNHLDQSWCSECQSMTYTTETHYGTLFFQNCFDCGSPCPSADMVEHWVENCPATSIADDDCICW